VIGTADASTTPPTLAFLPTLDDDDMNHDSSSDTSSEGGDDPPIRARWAEVGVSLVLMALATLVILDSLRVGIGWADDGPRSGYFPFYIGLLLMGSAGWTAVRQLWHWKRDTTPFATREELSRVVTMLVPIVIFVALVATIGLYVAGALLIGWFMARHGRYAPAATAAVSIGVPLLLFLVFERWFLVPLPKGPLETLLGY
jgi:putative tricarboxylic transport membrane protein